MKFTLEITLGNAAMQTADDVAGALRKLADDIEGPGDWTGENADAHGGIMDINGNTVGKWRVKRVKPRAPRCTACGSTDTYPSNFRPSVGSRRCNGCGEYFGKVKP